ncbi:MAG TPA: peptidoglycan DD-metalloendopeptidase family protein [Candidatus Limnocylindrales bacterium]|nr:peptidoglycan DD-metalloendopeptidase family protein [Candidatus Limnocylindrales bacterium]
MRRSTPDRRVRVAGLRTGNHRFAQRFILLLFALSTFGGLFTSTLPQKAHADELDDAYARQKQLEKLISQQKSSIRDLTAGQADLAARINNTKDSLADINANLVLVKTQIVGMTVDVARSQQSVDELNSTAVQLDAELKRIEADEVAKTAELESRKALLASRIVEAYDTDRTSMLETFLAGGDFNDVMTNVGYHLEFAEQDRELAQQIVSDQQVLGVLHQNVELARTQTADLKALAKEAKAKLDDQMEELSAAKARLVQLEAETQRLLAAQKAAFAKMVRDKAKLQATLKAQLVSQNKLEGLIDRLVKEQLAKGGIPSQYNGTFIWPMPGTVTQEFGCTGFSWEPAFGSCDHYHRGIDIANDMYTPIHAAGEGKVIFAGLSPYDPAWIVIIAHSSQLVSWYGHIDNNAHPPAVHAGEYVTKGQVIAYEGMTGYTTGPHLHWAVQLDGAWVNPRLFLSRN